MTKKVIKKPKNKLQKIYDYVVTHELLMALLLATAVIIVGSVMGIENNNIIPSNSSELFHSSTNRLDFFSNWDGARYLSIATHGYSQSFLAGWFPFYPVLIFILSKVIGSALMSALIISWLCLVGAIYYYVKIIKYLYKITDNVTALKATLFFVMFPSGVYLLAAYTESLFSLLSLAAIYYALNKRYLPAAILCMFATATHINGSFLLLLVALILYEEKERIRNIFATLVIGCLGLVAYMAYLITKFHNPFEFIVAQRQHHWLKSSLASELGKFGVIDYALAFLVLWTTIYWWKRRKSFAIYSGLYLLIPLVGGQFGGYPRYCLVIFPFQFMLFEYARKRDFLYTALLIIFSVTWAYILLQYAAGYVIS